MTSSRKSSRSTSADSREESPTAELPSRYEGLARRYRPQTFEDVIGQRAVVQTLRKAVESRRWSSAYLFIGGRGLGKTTMARILAKALLCEKGPTPEPCGTCDACVEIAASRHIDVLEIDAASNTGVDNVRDTIIQAVATSPVKGRAKIFIIDEVHMLSQSAFNALLKTIEEPPPHVMFIMATTDGHKVPATIRSRCQRFDFRPLAPEELGARLLMIAKEEKISIDEGAINVICDYAEGGVRDAISALDLVRSFSTDRITTETAEDALGVIPAAAIQALMERIAEADAAGGQARFTELLAVGADPSEILRGLLIAFRRLLLEEVQGRSVAFSRGRLIRSLEAVLVATDRARHSRHPRLEAEVLICRLAGMSADEVTLRDLYARLLDLERGGGVRSEASGSAGAAALTPRSSPLAPSGAPRGRAGGAPAAADPDLESPEDEARNGPSSRSEAPVDQPSGALTQERFIAELERISPVAAALVRDARPKLTGAGGVALEFGSSGLLERYRKDLKAQVAVASALEGVLGRRVTVTPELGSSSRDSVDVGSKDRSAAKSSLTSDHDSSAARSADRPNAHPANGPPTKGKKNEELDPEIERIRKLFGAEIVEVIE